MFYKRPNHVFFGAPFYGFEMKLWISLMYVVLWSIWRIRNRVIFEQYTPNWELESRMIKTSLGYWAKGWCVDLPFSAEQFVLCIQLGSHQEVETDHYTKEFWVVKMHYTEEGDV